MYLKHLCLVIAGLSLYPIMLWATDFTITVTVPTSEAANILSTVTAWRNRQLDDGGNPKYANNTDLGQAILYGGLRRILKDQCEFDPVTCAPNIKTFLDARDAASQSFLDAIDTSVEP